MAVDTPRDVYLAAKAMRGKRPGYFAEKDLLTGLYIGIGALPPDPFYDAAWAAMEEAIRELEARA